MYCCVCLSLKEKDIQFEIKTLVLHVHTLQHHVTAVKYIWCFDNNRYKVDRAFYKPAIELMTVRLWKKHINIKSKTHKI